MKKCYRLAMMAMLCLPIISRAQCITAPAPPLPCTGTEPLVLPDETLNAGTTKWYYGSATTYNSLTLSGGTLIVCGDLTIDKFYIDSGTIYVRPGARFVVAAGIGSGIILRGNTAIYNFGTCEILRNVSLESGWSGPDKPNVVVNATTSSVFRMSSQYLVINNPHSWFVNNGDAEFWGTIQDPLSLPGSICLGDGSTTNMAVLINKVNNGYTVPEGSACLRVRQYSQFYGALTAQAGLRVCLGSGHSTDMGCTPWGCTPNNWGAATLLTNCSSCAAFAVLEVRISGEKVTVQPGGKHDIRWRMENAIAGGRFRILRSFDETVFQAIDSFTITSSNQSHFSITDKAPASGMNYYMIQYIHPEQGHVANSKTLKILSEYNSSILVYPVPFRDQLTIQYSPDNTPDQVLLTDITGRNIRIVWYRLPQAGQIRVQVLEPLSGDMYLIHMRTPQSTISKTLLRN